MHVLLPQTIACVVDQNLTHVHILFDLHLVQSKELWTVRSLVYVKI